MDEALAAVMKTAATRVRGLVDKRLPDARLGDAHVDFLVKTRPNRVQQGLTTVRLRPLADQPRVRSPRLHGAMDEHEYEENRPQDRGLHGRVADAGRSFTIV